MCSSRLPSHRRRAWFRPFSSRRPHHPRFVLSPVQLLPLPTPLRPRFLAHSYCSRRLELHPPPRPLGSRTPFFPSPHPDQNTDVPLLLLRSQFSDFWKRSAHGGWWLLKDYKGEMLQGVDLRDLCVFLYCPFSFLLLRLGRLLTSSFRRTALPSMALRSCRVIALSTSAVRSSFLLLFPSSPSLCFPSSRSPSFPPHPESDILSSPALLQSSASKLACSTSDSSPTPKSSSFTTTTTSRASSPRGERS